MSNEESNAIYFISEASSLSGIHQQTIRTYENKVLLNHIELVEGLDVTLKMILINLYKFKIYHREV